MKKTLLCALMFAATAPAFADYRSPADGVDQRQYRLERRIEDGRRSGQLTRAEYGRLRNELALIARDERAFRADGRLSPREAQQLHVRLDSLSRDVAYDMRDGERRGPYYNDHRADRRF